MVFYRGHFRVGASVSLRGGHPVYLRVRFADRKTQKGVKRLRESGWTGAARAEVRASLEFILRVVVAIPGQFFFNLNLEQNPAVHCPLPTPISLALPTAIYRTLDKQQ